MDIVKRTKEQKNKDVADKYTKFNELLKNPLYIEFIWVVEWEINTLENIIDNEISEKYCDVIYSSKDINILVKNRLKEISENELLKIKELEILDKEINTTINKYLRSIRHDETKESLSKDFTLKSYVIRLYKELKYIKDYVTNTLKTMELTY